jgi:hypothetical protein
MRIRRARRRDQKAGELERLGDRTEHPRGPQAALVGCARRKPVSGSLGAIAVGGTAGSGAEITASSARTTSTVRLSTRWIRVTVGSVRGFVERRFLRR